MPAPGDQYRATAASTNPFEEPIHRVSEYTAQEIATLQSRLDKQLGPEYISSRPGNGGGKVHYLAAEKVINLANEVFGFNGWSSQIQNVQIDFCDESESSGKITLGLSIIVRVTLRDGTFHEDIGYGHIENCKGKAAAFEKAKKEAATDAMKRALRNFGNVLGNCLYDKDYLARVTKVKTAPSKWDAENLHRHPDFAPSKREPTNDAEPDEKPINLARTHSVNSMGAEFEDEFGANLFDGVELAESHDDETIPTTNMSRDTSVDRGQNNPRAGPPPQRGQSVAMPPPRRTLSGPVQQQHQHTPSNPAVPIRPQIPSNPAPPPHFDPAERGRPQNPTQINNHQSRHTSPQKSDKNIITGPSNPAPPRPSPQNQHSTPPNLIPPPGQSPQTEKPDIQPPQQHNPHEPPVGFITSRAAEMINKQTPLPANVRFNPKAESPSIPRTSGVNHATSAPVMRDAIKREPTAAPAGGPAAPAAPAAPALRIANAPNFINPSDNAGRRIGMPGGGIISPHNPNRTAYKPPTMAGGKRLYSEIAGPAVRPPLADVSNVTAPVVSSGGDGRGVEDVKKARLGEA